LNGAMVPLVLCGQ